MPLKHQLAKHEHYLLLSLYVLQIYLVFTVAGEYAPENEVVLAGRNVRLKCWSDGNGALQWKLKQSGNEETSITFNHNTTSGNARITLNTTIDGQYDLHITNVSRSDAGTYICITEKKSEVGDGSFITRRYEIQLVIITSHPNCNLSTVTGKRILEVNDYVQMQCYVQFVGDLVPVIKWRRGEESVAGAETNITKKPNGYQIKSSLSVQVNFMDDGVTFSCDTFFTPKLDNNSSDGYLIIASNIPDYKHTCTSPPVNVSYGPRTMAVHVKNMSDNGTIITAGDQLKCHASGNPTPRYEWIIFAEHSNFTKHGAEFVFDVNMLRNCQLIAECKAINEFGESRTRVNLTSNVAGIGSVCTTEQRATRDSTTQPNQPKNSQATIVFVVFALAGILATLILTVIIRKHTCRSDKAQVETGKSLNHCNVPQVYLGAIYEEIHMQENDLIFTNGHANGVHNESVEQLNSDDDILCPIGSNSRSPGDKPEKPKEQLNVGADGTIYTEVGTTQGIANLYSSVQIHPTRKMFKKSMYAGIDHTIKGLPPPPKLSK